MNRFRLGLVALLLATPVLFGSCGSGGATEERTQEDQEPVIWIENRFNLDCWMQFHGTGLYDIWVPANSIRWIDHGEWVAAGGLYNDWQTWTASDTRGCYDSSACGTIEGGDVTPIDPSGLWEIILQ